MFVQRKDEIFGHMTLTLLLSICCLCQPLDTTRGIQSLRQPLDTTRVPVTDCFLQLDTTEDHDVYVELTCDYPWDLNQTEQSFSVDTFLGDERENVLRCHWSGGEVHCSSKAGYSQPKTISNVFTMAVPKNESQKYCCDIFPSKESTDVKSCYFHLTDQPHEENKTDTKGSHQNLKKEIECRADQHFYRYFFIVSMAFNVLTTIVFIALILKRYTRCGKLFSSKNEKTRKDLPFPEHERKRLAC